MPTFKEAAEAVSLEDGKKITKLAKAASAIVPGADPMETSMDLIMVHACSCPLDLDRMLQDVEAGDVGSFGHDIGGITRHLDRDSGELTSCFWPRYARSQ